MNWKLISTVAGGFAGGFLARKVLSAEKNVADPEKILAEIKKRFAEHGTVTGTWMVMLPEKFQKNLLTFEVYQGGITISQNNKEKKFEFIVDAKTGSIIQLEPHSQSHQPESEAS